MTRNKRRRNVDAAKNFPDFVAPVGGELRWSVDVVAFVINIKGAATFDEKNENKTSKIEQIF